MKPLYKPWVQVTWKNYWSRLLKSDCTLIILAVTTDLCWTNNNAPHWRAPQDSVMVRRVRVWGTGTGEVLPWLNNMETSQGLQRLPSCLADFFEQKWLAHSDMKFRCSDSKITALRWFWLLFHIGQWPCGRRHWSCKQTSHSNHPLMMEVDKSS
jgi:hypothetical protein